MTTELLIRPRTLRFQKSISTGAGMRVGVNGCWLRLGDGLGEVTLLPGFGTESEDKARTARAIKEQARLTDGWDIVVPLVLLRLYAALEDVTGVDREAAALFAMPEVIEPVKLVSAPGAQAPTPA